MNEQYRKLKKKYDELDEQILAMHMEKQRIRDLMEEVCTHEDTHEVDPDPYSYDDEPKHKCRDCYRYFTESELKALRATTKGEGDLT